MSTMTVPISTICCAACSRAIDASTAELCTCITAQTSFVCSHCGACLCRNAAAMKSFLRNATADVKERYERERLRRRDRPSGSNHMAKVLIVDDDEEIREVAAFMIANMGCSVSTASDAAEAMIMIEAEAPDIVFTDALMPKVDGRTLCRLIKKSNPRIKVVVMTSLYTAQRYKSEAHKLFKSDDYLAKPIQVAVVRQVLSRLTNGRVREKE